MSVNEVLRQGPSNLTAYRLLRTATDVTLLAVSYVLATMLRFDWLPPAGELNRMWAILPLLTVAQYLALRRAGSLAASWRFTGVEELRRLARSLAVVPLLLLAVNLLARSGALPEGLVQRVAIPLGIIAAYYLVSLMLLAAARLIRRSLAVADAAGETADAAVASHRTLLVGAGEAGAAVLTALRRRPEVGLRAVGFVDDDASKHVMTIHGVEVLGGLADAGELIERLGVERVLLTISRPSGALVRAVNDFCVAAGVQLQTVPGLSEIAGGHINLSRIRTVQLEDLLGREPVTTDTDEIALLVRDQVVMVTGAGGSIGSELCRQLLAFGPSRLVLFERTENALYEIDRELAATAPDDVLVSVIGDVCDRDRVREVLRDQHPSVVFHAAAHKHVPMMEANPSEAIKNNALGTQTLVDACVDARVPRFVLISTDKAVNPTSVMGATKRLAERYVMAVARNHGVAYSAVRFGNVLGSNGSVVPLFRQQLAAGGPLTVTHPEVKRFFMTIPEAVQLVLQTAVMAEGGEVFILDMGTQVRIVDLARHLIQLSGLREGEDVEIVFTGLRPGEKLYEELGLASEESEPTRHSKILRWKGPDEVSLRRLQAEFAAVELDAERPRVHLQRLVEEYQPTGARGAPLTVDVAAAEREGQPTHSPR